MPIGWFNQKRMRGGIPLDDVFDASYAELVRDLVAAGAMVSAGATRDGGAAHLTVFYAGSKRREYVECREDMLAFLGQALDAVTGAGDGEPAPGSGAKRRGAEAGP